MISSPGIRSPCIKLSNFAKLQFLNNKINKEVILYLAICKIGVLVNFSIPKLKFFKIAQLFYCLRETLIFFPPTPLNNSLWQKYTLHKYVRPLPGEAAEAARGWKLSSLSPDFLRSCQKPLPENCAFGRL